MDLVAEILHDIWVWAECCPCHTKDFGLPGPRGQGRRSRFLARTEQHTCPLKGRRGAELATGQLDKWVHRLLDVASSRFTVALRTAGLQQEQQGIIVSDLAQARAHLVFILQVKMAHWGRLPYLLFGLAHHSPMVAVAAAKAAVEAAQS